MPIITTWSGVEALPGGPTTAEEKLRASCAAGETCRIADEPPETCSQANRIRADVLRYFILGGCPDAPVRGGGVWLQGAWIDGTLNLDHQTVRRRIALFYCRIAAPIVAHTARLDALYLNGSQNIALYAENAEISGHLNLQAAHFLDHVLLSGARIRGKFSAQGAHFRSTGNGALTAENACFYGGINLEKIVAAGPISFSGAEIRGQLSLVSAKIDADPEYALNAQDTAIGSVHLSRAKCTGTVSFSDATIERSFYAENASFASESENGLNLEAIRIRGALILRGEKAKLSGGVSLDKADIALLADDLAFWDGANPLQLRGFSYKSITEAPPKLSDRLDWVERGCSLEGRPYPQPFTQYAKVIRTAGHEAEARTVLYHRDRLLRRDARSRRNTTVDGTWRSNIGAVWQAALCLRDWVWDHVLRWVVGYGHKPFRSVVALVVLLALATFLADRAWETGRFAPASAVVLTSPGWGEMSLGPAAATFANPADAWSRTTLPGRDWQSFNRYIWAADLVIPLVPFGQVDAWQPSAARGGWGWWLWALAPVLNALGWLVTALGAAAVTGIVRRE